MFFLGIFIGLLLTSGMARRKIEIQKSSKKTKPRYKDAGFFMETRYIFQKRIGIPYSHSHETKQAF